MTDHLEGAIAADQHWVLTLGCKDRPGIVHALSGAIVSARGNITESQQFSSTDTGRFFIRLQIESALSQANFEAMIAPIADRLDAEWQLDVVGRPIRTLLLGSTAAHCVNNLLFRQRSGYLPIHVP